MLDLDEELDNWRRTVRVGRVIHFCGSAEKHYRAPAELLEMTGDALPSIPPLNVRRGWRVELAWRHLPSMNMRLLLSWHYIRNRHLDEAARRAKIERRKAEFILQQGRAGIRAELMKRHF